MSACCVERGRGINPCFLMVCLKRSISVLLPGSGLRILMSRVAHGAELRHKEVVAAMIGRRVLLDVCKLHELGRGREGEGGIHH